MTAHIRDELKTIVTDELRIDVIDNLAQIEALWRLASIELSGYVFQCFDWLAVWNATVGAPQGITPALVQVTDAEGRTLMLIPLGIRRFHGCRVLVFLGGEESDYKAPLIDPTFATACFTADFAGLWAAILRRLPRIDIVWFSGMPATIAGAPNPFVTLRGSAHIGYAYAATPLPDSFEAYRKAHRSALFRKAARLYRNGADGSPVRLERVADPAEMLLIFDLTLAWKRKRYGNDFMSPGGERFYRQILRSRLTAATPFVARLWIEDTVVATEVGMVQGNRFYGLLTAYESGPWSRLSPGRLLMTEIVRWCIAEGLETFDLTRGDEEYKKDFTDTQTSLHACSQGPTRKGRIVLFGLAVMTFIYRRALKNPRLQVRTLALKDRLTAIIGSPRSASSYG
jgi:CelD/BcsL family acetyltransferase involved in cellulose biosynthesis